MLSVGFSRDGFYSFIFYTDVVVNVQDVEMESSFQCQYFLILHFLKIFNYHEDNKLHRHVNYF